MRTYLFLAAPLLTTTALTSAARPQAETAPLPFRDTSLSVDRRVDDLIARLTPAEKASPLVNQARAIPRREIPAYNWWSEALHGGANNGYETVFPEPIGLTATFDVAATKQMGISIGEEGRVRCKQVERSGTPHRIMQGLTFWSLKINICAPSSPVRGSCSSQRPMSCGSPNRFRLPRWRRPTASPA